MADRDPLFDIDISMYGVPKGTILSQTIKVYLSRDIRTPNKI